VVVNFVDIGGIVDHHFELSFLSLKGSSWAWSYGSWIYNYLCNQCISALKLLFRTPFMARCTRVNNSTNINKINNHLSPEIIQHKKTIHMTWKSRTWQRTGTKCCGYKLVNDIITLPSKGLDKVFLSFYCFSLGSQGLLNELVHVFV
jgi:hypothetical protein